METNEIIKILEYFNSEDTLKARIQLQELITELEWANVRIKELERKE